MDAAVDHAVYLSHFLSCMRERDHRPSGTAAPLFRDYPVTDCRSLYDALQRLSASLQEKRVLLDLVSIREACGGNLGSSSSVRWVPGQHQLADGLTKPDKAPAASLWAGGCVARRQLSRAAPNLLLHAYAMIAYYTWLGVFASPSRPLASRPP